MMSTSVCLSARISPKPHVRSLPSFLVHDAYDRGLVLLRRGDEIPRGKGNFGGFFPTHNELYGPNSDMNFAMKDRFGLNLLT